MATNLPAYDSIFCSAIEIEATEERAAFIARACGSDAELRLQVEQLVAAHFQAGSFLEQPAVAPVTGAYGNPMAEQASREGPGTRIGPYKLLEQIGEGGMGVVWMAEQTEPVRRRVALKVIKTGMDSRQVVARFEAERQALALMDHPNIAHVLDAGETPPAYAGGSPRPFFVMELVRGTPITAYCDEHRLTPRQRLELFTSVCQAIQHAHHKGIIHRDVKPSNVLVAPYDGKPVVKVIDFGVAKAIGQQLTERTLFTAFGTVIGTLEYMSPEQAELNNQDIDTRSDVYSLGVLLYELLTGAPPLRREQVQRASFLDVLRQIREEETPRPSDRLSTSETLPTVAASRGLEPAQLMKVVRGELDWIVLKALEKDRGRRYETANGLACDLQRYLADEPVEACPPSARYRLGKLLRRHRRVLIPAAAFGALLASAAVVSTWLAVWALRAEKDALGAGQKVRETLGQVTEQKNRAEKAEKETTEEAAALRTSFRFFQEDLLGLSETGDQEVLREANVKLRTVLDRASNNVAARFEKRPNEEARVRVTLGNAYRLLLDYPRAEAHLRRALELQRGLLGPEHPDTLAAMHFLGRVYLDQSRAEEGEKLIAQTLDARRRVLGEKHRDTLRSLNNLATARLRIGGKREDVLQLFLQGLETSRQELGPEDPLTLQFQYNAAATYVALGHLDRAEPLYEKTLAAQQRVLGPDRPATYVTALQFGILYVKQSQAVKAAPLLDQALEGYTRLLKTQEVQTSNLQAALAAGLLRAVIDSLASQGCDLLDKKQYDASAPLLRQYLDTWKKHGEVLQSVQPRSWHPHHVRLLLGRCLAGQQKFEEAEPLLLAGLEETWQQSVQGKVDLPTSPFSRDFELVAVRNQVVAFYRGRQAPEKAAALLEKTRQPR